MCGSNCSYGSGGLSTPLDHGESLAGSMISSDHMQEENKTGQTQQHLECEPRAFEAAQGRRGSAALAWQRWLPSAELSSSEDSTKSTRVDPFTGTE